MIYVAWIICFIFFLTTCFFAYHTYKFGKTILSVQDVIEESLEVINDRIASISKVLEVPLFFDSPEIRRVHEDLRSSRDAIIKIAESFSTIEEKIEEDEK